MIYPRFFEIKVPAGFYAKPVRLNPWGLSSVSDLSSLSGGIQANVGEGARWTCFGDFFGGLGYVDAKVKDNISGEVGAPELQPVEFVKIEPRKLRQSAPPAYYWFSPPSLIDVNDIEVIVKHGVKAGRTVGAQVSSSPVPSQRFYKNTQGQGFIYCDFRAVMLARRYKWKDLRFSPIDVPAEECSWEWGADYLGKQWPPQWWPEGYEPHPSNIIEGEVPEVKVGEGLGNEPEEPRTKVAAKRRRPIDPSGRLISVVDVEKLKPKQDDDICGLVAEVPLNRPLYGFDTLEVTVVIEDEESAPKRSVIKECVQGVLNLLERLLPDIESRIKAELTTPVAGDVEAGLASLHSPSLLFMAEELENPLRWSFVVEGDPVAVHVEFERLTIVDVWSGGKSAIRGFGKELCGDWIRHSKTESGFEVPSGS